VKSARDGGRADEVVWRAEPRSEEWGMWSVGLGLRRVGPRDLVYCGLAKLILTMIIIYRPIICRVLSKLTI